MHEKIYKFVSHFYLLMENNLNFILEKESSLGNNLTREKAELKFFHLELARVAAIRRIEKGNHNPYRHGDQIVAYAEGICQEMAIPQDERFLIECAAKWHDIGKIKIPQRILDKPSNLTEKEWEIIKKHPIYSEDLIKPFGYIAGIARYHHEWIDGSGYPDGLKNGKILLGSKIIAVIDSYNAMTHDRGYNHVKIPQQAIEELEKYKGIQFDRDVVDCFIKVLNLRKKSVSF